MKIDEFLAQAGEWMRGTGPESDVVVSSRLRLARNLRRFPFLTIASPSVRGEIEAYIRERIPEKAFPQKISYLSLESMKLLERHLLVERHLISRDHANGGNHRGVIISHDEALSIMVNEEDHLRLQVLRSGLQFDEAWDEINKADSILEESLHFAFHPQFGYLTACPTNVGTGLRVSVLLHLPALVFTKQMEKVLSTLSRINYAVRGLFGEGTSPLGDYFQISNQITLGKREQDIIQELKNAIPHIIQYERAWRQKLYENERKKLEDRIWRAYVILKNSRCISSEETMELLSAVRLGLNLGIIEGVSMKVINELFIFIQPAHLQKLAGKTLEAFDRDVARADFIRKKLS